MNRGSSSSLSSGQQRKAWRVLTSKLVTQKTKIKTLQRAKQRLRSKVRSLNSLLHYLKDKHLISENALTAIGVRFLTFTITK